MTREHALKVKKFSEREYGGECLADLCGWRPLRKESRHEIEDEFRRHEEQVQRARAGLRTRTPSLKSERDWYRERSQDTTIPIDQREMWKALADELDLRLNDADTQDSLQGTLPFA